MTMGLRSRENAGQGNTCSRGYKTWVHSQTQNKAQWLAACGHVSASSKSFRFILSLRMNSSFINSRPDLHTIKQLWYQLSVCFGDRQHTHNGQQLTQALTREWEAIPDSKFNVWYAVWGADVKQHLMLIEDTLNIEVCDLTFKVMLLWRSTSDFRNIGCNNALCQNCKVPLSIISQKWI